MTEQTTRARLDAAIGEAEKRDRIYPLRQMPPDIAPKWCPVLVAGGIAMKKTGGEWYSGMCEPPFSRKLNWEPEWWANLPQQNGPLPASEDRSA